MMKQRELEHKMSHKMVPTELCANTYEMQRRMRLTTIPMTMNEETMMASKTTTTFTTEPTENTMLSTTITTDSTITDMDLLDAAFFSDTSSPPPMLPQENDTEESPLASFNWGEEAICSSPESAWEDGAFDLDLAAIFGEEDTLPLPPISPTGSGTSCNGSLGLLLSESYPIPVPVPVPVPVAEPVLPAPVRSSDAIPGWVGLSSTSCDAKLKNLSWETSASSLPTGFQAAGLFTASENQKVLWSQSPAMLTSNNNVKSMIYALLDHVEAGSEIHVRFHRVAADQNVVTMACSRVKKMVKEGRLGANVAFKLEHSDLPPSADFESVKEKFRQRVKLTSEAWVDVQSHPEGHIIASHKYKCPISGPKLLRMKPLKGCGGNVYSKRVKNHGLQYFTVTVTDPRGGVAMWRSKSYKMCSKTKKRKAGDALSSTDAPSRSKKARL